MARLTGRNLNQGEQSEAEVAKAAGSQCNESRPKLYEELGTKSVLQVAKETGVQRGALETEQKAKYEEKANQLKADDQLELQKLESGGVPERRASPKAVEAAPGTQTRKRVSRKSINKAEKDPNAPKKPAPAFFLWFNDNRAEIAASLPAGSNKGTDVSKAAGVRWKTLAAAERQSYEEKYADAKAEYKRLLENYQGTAAA